MVSSAPHPSPQSTVPPDWKSEYIRQIQWQLERTTENLGTLPANALRKHGRSYLALLTEAHHYPLLNSSALELIARLHPLPIRWGWGYVWEAELRFALDNTPEDQAARQAEYRCGLADVYLPLGRFDDAIQLAGAVLAMPDVPILLAARALRTLFTCHRSTGQGTQADELMITTRPLFLGDTPAKSVAADKAQAWMIYQTLRLEQMREQGKIKEGLALVDEIIWLDDQIGSPDALLTAELITFRSTYRWEVSRYAGAVEDLTHAIEMYAREGDLFNSESLYSNLGLVYWTMGELDRAEEALNRAIAYYRQAGSEQLITYDIGNLALTYFCRGNLDTAQNLVEQHIAHARRLNFLSELHRAERILPKILLYRGQVDGVLAAMEASVPYFSKRGSRDAYYLNFLWMALCRKATGQGETALAECSRVLEFYRQNHSALMLQLTLRCMAYLLPLEEQEPLLLESLELARQIDRRLEEAAVLLMLGRAARDPQFAQECWRAGGDLMRKQGAAAWLEGTSPENPPFYPPLM